MMKAFLAAAAIALAGPADASVFVGDIFNFDNYFYHNPVRVGKSVTIRGQVDFCQKRYPRNPEATECGVQSIYFPADPDFWTLAYDGAEGTPEIAQVHFFTLTFHPAYYVDPYGPDAFGKLFFWGTIWMYYEEPFGGNENMYPLSIDARILPPAPVPVAAGLPMLASVLGGLGLMAARRRRSSATVAP